MTTCAKSTKQRLRNFVLRRFVWPSLSIVALIFLLLPVLFQCFSFSFQAAEAASRNYRISQAPVAKNQLVYSLEADDNGNIWLGTSSGLVRHHNEIQDRFVFGKDLLAERVYDLFLDSAERLWVAYGPQLVGQQLTVSMYKNGGWRHFGGIESGAVFSFTEDLQGNIYAGAFFERGGLYVLGHNQFGRVAEFPEEIAINDLYTDEMGTIWIASTDSGIFTFDPLSKIRKQYAASRARVRLRQGLEDAPLPNNDIRCIGQDDGGDMWFGGEFEKSDRQIAGLVRFDRNKTWITYDRDNSGLLDERVFAIVRDPKKGMWFATAVGVNYYASGEWEAFATAEGLDTGSVNDLLVLSPNDIWLATQESAWKLTEFDVVRKSQLEVTDLSISVGDEEVLLGWAPILSPDVSGYVVMQSLDQGKTFNERTYLSKAEDYFVRLTNLTNGAIYIFRVLVQTRDGGLSDGTSVTAIPQEGTIPLPLAHAGKDQITAVGVKTRLDGSNSQYFTDSASYRWTLESGPVRAVQFNSTDIVRPSFIPTVPGQYTLSLLITDAKGQKSILNDLSKVIVSVKLPNEIDRPIAKLKHTEVQVTVGETVVLDASESVFNTSGASFVWDVVDGPTKNINWDLTDISKPSFLAKIAGVYKFSLVVTDTGNNNSNPVFVDVLISEPETYTLFSDLPDSHWSREYFTRLKLGKIVSGYEDGTVRPFQSISRAEFLKLVFEIVGIIPDVTAQESAYIDVSDNQKWYFKYVVTAHKKGVVGGDSNDKFYPDNSITRAEALKILLLSSGLLEGKSANIAFPDIKEGFWYVPYIGRALQLQLINGFEDNTFRPEQGITRAEAAKIIILLGDYLMNERLKPAFY